jgi:hypothetical protein
MKEKMGDVNGLICRFQSDLITKKLQGSIFAP